MSSSKFEFAAWTSIQWNQRAESLLAEAEATSGIVNRERLRRRAVAAQNIADALDLSH